LELAVGHSALPLKVKHETYLGTAKFFSKGYKTSLSIVLTLTMLLLGAGLYTGLFASPPDYQQGEAMRIMYVHVPASWMALFVYGFLALMSLFVLVWRHPLAEILAISSVPIGALFTALSLATGSLWGKPMWGAYWVWDARLTSVLVLLFLYGGYWALYKAHARPEQGCARRVPSRPHRCGQPSHYQGIGCLVEHASPTSKLDEVVQPFHSPLHAASSPLDGRSLFLLFCNRPYFKSAQRVEHTEASHSGGHGMTTFEKEASFLAPGCHSCEGRNPVRPLKQNIFSQFILNGLFFSTFPWVPAFAGMTRWWALDLHIQLRASKPKCIYFLIDFLQEVVSSIA
jgi:hypothetical protein